MDRRRILVVDDEQHMLLTVQFILQSAGYAVRTARSGEEALEVIGSCSATCEGFDLILTDIQMQGMTGLQLIDSLRASGIEAPVLVMTGYGNDESVRELRRKGCTEFLEKPFDEEDLLRKVRQLCGSGY
jgi:CheY-like chemotaxis protein